MADLLKVRYGLKNNLPTTKDDSTLYFVTDSKQIYRGNVEYTGNIQNIELSDDSTIADGKRTLTITFKDGTTALTANILNSKAVESILNVLDGQGNAATKGLVKLSDATNLDLDTDDGTAATPKAVKDALEAANNYADSLLAANDAMVFKGTIGTGGTVPTLPTNKYSAGWTYKVITAGTYAELKCEVGDMLIAIKDGPSTGSAVVNEDWTVVQANIDGAVTAADNFTADQLVIGGENNKTVKSLSAGSNDQVLTVVDGKPQWKDLPTEKDTTYDFEAGSDGSFYVTSSDEEYSNSKISIGKPATAGTADKVENSLTIKIADNDKNLINTTGTSFDGDEAVTISFGTAAAKGVSTSVENTGNVITASAVYNALLWKDFSTT